MELGMIISGTYFGTQDEYDALNFESRLAQNATVTVHTIDNWLGAVTNWAENEALKLIGGVVSCSFILTLKKHPYSLFIASLDPSTRRVSRSPLTH
jgi:hypothetical protein